MSAVYSAGAEVWLAEAVYPADLLGAAGREPPVGHPVAEEVEYLKPPQAKEASVAIVGNGP